MPVIALTQEMGSLAKDVALRVAQEGKLAVMRHEVLEGVADKMRVPTSVISRLREGKAGLVERLQVDRSKMAVHTAKEVFALADKGNIVLRGWGATCLLRPVAHVLTVRITRSFDKRVAWLMDHLGTDDEAFAGAELRRSDDAHASRMHALFGVTWGDPLLYDLVLNTDRVAWRAARPRSCSWRPGPSSRRPPPPGRCWPTWRWRAVRAALKENESTREVNIDIQGQVARWCCAGSS